MLSLRKISFSVANSTDSQQQVVTNFKKKSIYTKPTSDKLFSIYCTKDAKTPVIDRLFRKLIGTANRIVDPVSSNYLYLENLDGSISLYDYKRKCMFSNGYKFGSIPHIFSSPNGSTVVVTVKELSSNDTKSYEWGYHNLGNEVFLKFICFKEVFVNDSIIFRNITIDVENTSTDPINDKYSDITPKVLRNGYFFTLSDNIE
ncbi:MAG: hypothetical protein IKP79_01225 [Bacilli bacterium]|nr:hypothetical protein [Bacilli bacterium]